MKTRYLTLGELEGYGGLEPRKGGGRIIAADCEVEGFPALAIADGEGLSMMITVGPETVEWSLQEHETIADDLLEALPSKLSLAQLQLLGFSRIS